MEKLGKKLITMLRIFLLLFFIAFYTSRCECQVIIDDDKDGLNDFFEDSIANLYAPIIIHDKGEKYFPTNVDLYLSQSSLWFYDDECDFLFDWHENDYVKIKDQPSQRDLVDQVFDKSFCGSGGTVYSKGTLSNRKQRTFYLKDVPENLKVGSEDSKKWITYLHVYPNEKNGVTVQYWRFYAFNGLPPIEYVPESFRGKLSELRSCCHGGDWECVQVVLDSLLKPIEIRLPGHTHIETFGWNQVKVKNGTHPLIYSVVEGHTSILAKGNETGIIQETFLGGKIYLLDNTIKENGKLLNVGEKCNPLNNQFFLQYSGLWGSPGVFYETSGYWGPAYNETDLDKTKNFVTAWGSDMKNKDIQFGEIKECYPMNTSR